MENGTIDDLDDSALAGRYMMVLKLNWLNSAVLMNNFELVVSTPYSWKYVNMCAGAEPDLHGDPSGEDQALCVSSAGADFSSPCPAAGARKTLW